MNSARATRLHSGDRLPEMIVMPARCIIDGMHLWGQLGQEGCGARLNQYYWLVESMPTPSKSDPDVLRIEVSDPVEGETFLLVKSDALVLVGVGPKTATL